MVLAGPGSGKTSVIVERTAYMTSEGKIPPSSVLVVTFSRAAAKEMKERFLKRIGKSSTEVTFGTFHGVFYGILKQAYRLGPENILSEEEKYEILQEMIQNYGGDLSQDGEFPQELSREISLVKGNRIALEHYYASCCADEVFRQIFRGYRQEVRKRRKLDFDDMLLCCYELFRTRADVLRAWQEKFRYILVDEFQDISPIQYDIIRMMAKPENNLFIVGDDDQSIYHFRGARPELMLNFTKDYPDAETVLLDVNYRCSKTILNTAMKVIANNEKRFSKKLSTPNPEGEPVRLLVFENPREEYMSVARDLKKRLDAGEDLRDTAVLFRFNQEAEGLVSAFMEYQIPFTMKEQVSNIFRHWLCRDMLAYLHMAAGDRSRKTFLQVMNRPNRYIARESLTGTQVDFEELKRSYGEKDWICDRITTLQTHLRILSTLAPFAGINFIRCGIGYDEYLREYAQYRKIKPEELLEALDRIQESAAGMKTLEEWEQYIADYSAKLQEQAQLQKKQPEGVAVYTLHGVKGLEFRKVYIMNVNEGNLPCRKAVLPAAVEEERRLFYVGMTRAREQLYLCQVKRQFEKEREPSRFLEEAGV